MQGGKKGKDRCEVYKWEKDGKSVLLSKSVSHSVMSNSGNPWTLARQASLTMEFSRQEYKSV